MSDEQKEIAERIKSIRELCGYIIYHTHYYTNEYDKDGLKSLKRLSLIDGDAENIKFVTERIRELLGKTLETNHK